MAASTVAPMSDSASSAATVTHTLFKREAGSGPTSQFAHPGICTATFFDGDEAARGAVGKHLRARLRLVLDANPWLGGTLTKTGNIARLTCPVNGKDVSVDDIFSSLDTPVPNVTMSTPYDELVAACEPLAVGKGKELVATNARVTKCVVAPLASGSAPDAAGGFVVLFSMSHVVADGYTYYEILNMLSDAGAAGQTSSASGASTDAAEPSSADADAGAALAAGPAASAGAGSAAGASTTAGKTSAVLPAVRALEPARVAEYEPEGERRLMGERDFKYGTSVPFIKHMVSGIMRKPAGRAMAFYVDPAKVAEVKAGVAAAGAADVPFVSTNDVVTAHFFRSCGARIGMMTINYRSRWEALNATLAGNYEGVVLSDPDGHDTPEAVRRSLRQKPEGYFSGVVNTDKLPGFCGSCPCAFISSWASLGTSAPPFNITAGGAAVQRLHLPVLFMLPFNKSPMDVAIVFRAVPKSASGAEKLAVLYIAKQGGVEELLRPGDTVLGESVGAAMFPHGDIRAATLRSRA